jgi:hypothetical protein
MREDAGDRANAELFAAQAASAGNADALKVIAAHRQQERDHESEERMYRLAADAGDTEVLHILATMREEAGDHAEAERLAFMAVTADADDTIAFRRIVKMRAKTRDYHNAEVLALKAAAFGETWPLYELGSRMEARADAERIYKLAADRGDGHALEALALIRNYAGDYAGAEQLAQDAANAGNTQALVNLAKQWADSPILAATDTYRLYRLAATMGNAAALTAVTRYYSQAGNRAAAEKFALRAAVAGDTSAVRELAEKLFESGNLAEAQRLASKAVSVGDASSLNTLALICEQSGDQDEADHFAVEAARADEPWALRRLTIMRDESGDSIGAERLALKGLSVEHRQAIEDFTFIRAGDSRPIEDLIRRRDNAGDLHGAEQLALRAADMCHPWPLRRLAQGREYVGRRADALRLLELAATAYGDTDALLEIAKMHEDGCDTNSAERVYRKAVDEGNKTAFMCLAQLYEARDESTTAQRLLQFGLDASGVISTPWCLSDVNV